MTWAGRIKLVLFLFIPLLVPLSIGLKCYGCPKYISGNRNPNTCGLMEYVQCEEDVEFCIKIHTSADWELRTERIYRACARRIESDELGRFPECFNSTQLNRIPWVKRAIAEDYGNVKFNSVCLCEGNGCNGGQTLTTLRSTHNFVLIPGFLSILLMCT